MSVVLRATGDGLRATGGGSGHTVFEYLRVTTPTTATLVHLLRRAEIEADAHTAMGVRVVQSATRLLDACTRPRHSGTRTTTKSKMATVSDDNTVYIRI